DPRVDAAAGQGLLAAVLPDAEGPHGHARRAGRGGPVSRWPRGQLHQRSGHPGHGRPRLDLLRRTTAMAHHRPPVGIERITAYPCALSLDMKLLAEARDHDPRHPLEELWVAERSLNPPWEDPVTMAVNAALQIIE